MKIKAAVINGPHLPFEITEIDLDGPQENEVLVRYTHAGLCHSDLHAMNGDFPVNAPMVGGHEGAGIVEEVGPGVSRLKPGDKVVCSFIPSCGACRWCATGQAPICDWGAWAMDPGWIPDMRPPRSNANGPVSALCLLGTFAEYGTVHQNSLVKVEDYVPLDKAVLLGCGVTTGWGSAVYSAGVRPGDTVAIYGIGGLGSAAVQGAKYAGARHVVAIDPVEFKREQALLFGATHAVATAKEAAQLVDDLTWGVGADEAIITVGVVDQPVVSNAFGIIRKGGTLVITGMAAFDAINVQLSGAELSLYKKTVKGTNFGDSNPVHDIPKLCRLYEDGYLNLDDMITRIYSLEQVNQGYADLEAGLNIRGVIAL